MTAPIILHPGDRYGRLVVCREVDRKHVGGNPVRTVEFICDCGKLVVANLASVRFGTTRSCGCLRKKSMPLQEMLSYNQDTGKFTWRIKTSRGVLPGDEAGGVSVKGYIQISVGSKKFRAHRLAWYFVHGEWPADQIDHINGIRHDNRIANLRNATPQQNSQNRTVASIRSKSGLLGASWSERHGAWLSVIRTQGRHQRLGVFDTPQEASAAYMAARKEIGL